VNTYRRKLHLYLLALVIFFIAFDGTGISTALAESPRSNPAALNLPLPAPKNVAGPAKVYFPNFGQSIANPLLRFWRMHGRYDRFGGPMARAFVDSQGRTVQYFQKNALAYFPELAGTAWETRPYPLGRMLLESQSPDIQHAGPFSRVNPVANTKSLRYFPETGHTVANGFLGLYNSTGDLFMWGFPLSEEYSITGSDGKTWVSQLFELGRMRWSPQTGAMVDPNFGTEMANLTNVDVSVEIKDAKTPNYSTYLWEHWVDINLSQQYETFFEGDVPVYGSYVTTGKAGHETPTGTFYILRLVANERMRGGSIGSEDYYDLDNVLFTMYFTWEGHALHYAWWRSVFGAPGSHGCVNEDYNTAQFAWNFLTLGSRVSIHH
jgi:hypothetical protein